jgi:hypothetical protein
VCCVTGSPSVHVLVHKYIRRKKSLKHYFLLSYLYDFHLDVFNYDIALWATCVHYSIVSFLTHVVTTKLFYC